MIKTRRVRWVGHVAYIGAMKNVHKILVREHERKRPVGRLRHRCEDNIGMGLREKGLKVVGWLQLTLIRTLSTIWLHHVKV
jgi:hypothetical protein